MFIKISTFYDVCNLPKPSGMKGQGASQCTYYLLYVYALFSMQIFSISATFLLYYSLVDSLHSIVIALTFMPGLFEITRKKIEI